MSRRLAPVIAISLGLACADEGHDGFDGPGQGGPADDGGAGGGTHDGADDGTDTAPEDGATAGEDTGAGDTNDGGDEGDDTNTGGGEDADPSGGSGGTAGVQNWDGIEVYVITPTQNPAGPSPLIIALPDLGADVTKNADIIGTPQTIQGFQTTACTSCVVVGVQSINGGGAWDYESTSPEDHDRIRHVIERAFASFNVDKNRVMVFGLSRGGTQGFLMLDSGDLVTHISQAGGGGVHFRAMAAQSAKIKLYFQAGEFDNGVPIVTDKARELLGAGYDAHLKIWPGKGHGYGISENETILQWFLDATPPGDQPNCCIELP